MFFYRLAEKNFDRIFHRIRMLRKFLLQPDIVEQKIKNLLRFDACFQQVVDQAVYDRCLPGLPRASEDNDLFSRKPFLNG